jgi:hypothetical protein
MWTDAALEPELGTTRNRTAAAATVILVDLDDPVDPVDAIEAGGEVRP